MSPSIHLADHYTITKRGIVSDVSKTFDVLGWISPCVLVMKMVYQLLKTGWDEQVPPDIVDTHFKWR